MSKRFFETNKGISGGMLKGNPHYDSEGNSLGGIKAVVTDQGGTPVELEGNEVIINKKTVQSDKVLTIKGTPKEILSTLNQMDGNGVAIGDEDAEILAKYRNGGSIPKEIIMYHGSKNKFDKFNMINNTLRGIELGSHFGTYEQAKSFMSERYGENDKFYIYKCKLNLENTLKVDDIGWWTADNIYRFILKNKRYKLDFNDIDISTPENILKILKEKNIDSFKYSNLHEAEGDSYLVFDSSKIEILDTEIFRNGGELIKRADGTNTTFDGNNPDIRFAGGGKIEDSNGYLSYTINEDEITLDMIKSYDKRKGTATKLIEKLKDLSRENKLPIGLYAEPQDFSISDDDLIEFYYKNGFELDPDDSDGKLFIWKYKAGGSI
jgi:hypothetical protein